jgi:hypothetical protein
MSSLKTYATLVTNEAHRDFFHKGNLVEEWVRMYPMLFDSDDLRIALNQKQLGYHYYEWFAAVLLYHTTGLLSIDLQSRFETVEMLDELIKIVEAHFPNYFAYKAKAIVTKAVSTAGNRIQALQKHGFERLPEKALVSYDDYYVKYC